MTLSSRHEKMMGGVKQRSHIYVPFWFFATRVTDLMSSQGTLRVSGPSQYNHKYGILICSN